MNPQKFKTIPEIRPIILTWLGDKRAGMSCEEYRKVDDKDFVKKFLTVNGEVISPIDGSARRHDYFHSLDSYRRPRGLGCWQGLDRRPTAKNAPECKACSVKGECNPRSGTLWVRKSPEHGDNDYRFVKGYVDILAKLTPRRIPLVRLARTLYHTSGGEDHNIAERFIEEFHITQEELDKLFTDVPTPITIPPHRSSIVDSVGGLSEPVYVTEASSESGEDTRRVEGSGLSILPMIIRSTRTTGLYFTPWQIATFYTALQTKGFVILSGISGTGKTKLAQHFASMLPGQTTSVEPELNDEVISITVRPYMLKYYRFIIPKRTYQLFDPPPPGERQEVEVHFEGDKEHCQLVHWVSDRNDYVALHLRGAAREWFVETLHEDDVLNLTPLVDDEGNLSGFDLVAPKIDNPQVDRRSGEQTNLLFVPVRPDWRDSKSLLGYFNPLMGTYEWTPFLRFLLKARRSYEAKDGYCWFVILDEMNLARVEYYFADFLSVLESGRDEDGWTREPLRLNYPDDAEGDLPPRTVKIPPNLYVVGTVNVDETTHAFSPKVLDRAFSIELTETDFSDYPPVSTDSNDLLSDDGQSRLLDQFTRSSNFAAIDKKSIHSFIAIAQHHWVRNQLQSLNNLLRPHDLHFGYRVFDEIVAFLDNAERNLIYGDLGGLDAAFDAAVLMKVLPKFHGSRGRLEQPLHAVLAWCQNPESPNQPAIAEALKEARADTVRSILDRREFRHRETAKRASRMLWSLYTNGFASFG